VSQGSREAYPGIALGPVSRVTGTLMESGRGLWALSDAELLRVARAQVLTPSIQATCDSRDKAIHWVALSRGEGGKQNRL